MADSPTFLMCPPTYFDVRYVINPWMHGNEGTVGAGDAHAQWQALHALVTKELGAEVALVIPLVIPREGLPDIVFTANAGLTRSRVCIPARFRCPERQGEETHYEAWFRAHGYRVVPPPAGVAFEGAGDALFDASPGVGRCPLLWAASGFRTVPAAHAHLADVFGAEVVPLGLEDPRFYHLDTCFCPLPDGHLLWYPPAFDDAGRAEVERRVPASRRLAVSEEAACGFACNAVCVGRTLVMHSLPPDARALIEAWLAARGFALRTTPLGEFLKAGGSAKCLTLAVD